MEKKTSLRLAKQYIAEFSGVKHSTLADQDVIVQYAMRAVLYGKGQVHDLHVYSPAYEGVDVTLHLTQGHLAIHTWTNLGLATIDVFAWGAFTDPRKVITTLQKAMNPETVHLSEIQRGVVMKADGAYIHVKSPREILHRS